MMTLRTTRGALLGAVLFAPTLALAQPPGPPDGDEPRPVRGRRGGPGGVQGEDGPRPSGPPIMAALDTNRDGELSPEEIRSAAAALKALDRNRDGILDRSELDQRGGGPGGPDGPGEGPPQRRGVGDRPANGPDGPRQGGRFGSGPPDGPDGSPDRPGRGGRFGGPPPQGEDGPPGRGRGAGRARPSLGNVLPPFVREGLSLNDRQRKQISELESYVKGKLEGILTATQVRQVRALYDRGPGGPGGGPGGPGPGGPPDFRPGDEGDGPSTRPRRPQQP